MTRTMLETNNMVKRYDGFTAVDDLSFEVYEGDIFGLLGPNGAGKTTAIRTIMDIFKPDEGTITVLGHPPGVVRSRIGYLPEERGLYQDQKVLDVLIYLAELKGTSRTTAREHSLLWLERLELSDWAQKNVRDLSRGMQQKLQFVASVVHDPIGELPGVARVEQRDDTLTLTLKGITPQDLLRTLVERNIALEAFEVTTTPLEDIFIAVVKERDHA